MDAGVMFEALTLPWRIRRPGRQQSNTPEDAAAKTGLTRGANL
jgi:hypothetical protein